MRPGSYHDWFSTRTAAIGDMGSDTVEGMELLEDVYNADVSIQAREHSTTTIYLETGEQKALRAVEKNVGVTYNAKGYKVLPPQYRIIQGDGVNPEEIGRILSWMESMKFSAENVAFGMGGGLMQQLDRDTQRFAMKMCAAVIDGEMREVFKAPKTDPSKTSKKGYLDVLNDGTVVSSNVFGTINFDSAMEVVFEDGFSENLESFDDIRTYSDEKVMEYCV